LVQHPASEGAALTPHYNHPINISTTEIPEGAHRNQSQDVRKIVKELGVSGHSELI
jgi:hypothetical protein